MDSIQLGHHKLRMRREIMEHQDALRELLKEQDGEDGKAFNDFRYCASSNLWVQAAYDLLDPNLPISSAFQHEAEAIYMKALQAIYSYYAMAQEDAPFGQLQQQLDEDSNGYYSGNWAGE